MGTNIAVLGLKMPFNIDAVLPAWVAKARGFTSTITQPITMERMIEKAISYFQIFFRGISAEDLGG